MPRAYCCGPTHLPTISIPISHAQPLMYGKMPASKSPFPGNRFAAEDRYMASGRSTGPKATCSIPLTYWMQTMALIFPLSCWNRVAHPYFARNSPTFSRPKLDHARRALVNGHCHQKAQMGLDDEVEWLDKIGVDPEVLDSGCCGNGGLFRI